MTRTDHWIAFFLGALVALATAAAICLLFRSLRKGEDEDRQPTKDAPDPSETRRRQAKHRIELENLSRPDQTWQISLAEDLLIGRREDCAIVLSDPSVSRRQCKIVDSEAGPALFDLSHVNETQVDRVPAADGQILREGNVLTLGREQIRVRRILRLEDGEEDPFLGTAVRTDRGGPDLDRSMDTGRMTDVPQEDDDFW